MKRLIAILCLSLLAVTSTNAADAHGDTLATATLVTSPDIPARIDTPADVDWFRLDISQLGRVFIYSTGPTDTKFYLRDHTGRRLLTGYDQGAGNNFHVDPVLLAGTYYLEVFSGGQAFPTGDYTLSVRSPDNSVPFQGPDEAQSLEVAGEYDYFRFDLAQTSLVSLYSTGNFDTRARLYDSTGTLLISGYDGGYDNNFWIKATLHPDTYYLAICRESYGSLTGDYGLHIRTFANAVRHPESCSDQSIGVLGEVDFFRIEIHHPGLVYFYTTGYTDTKAALFESNGTHLASGYDEGANDNFRIGRVLQSGTYYLRIIAEGSGPLTGAYTLNIRQPSNATLLPESRQLTRSIHVPGDLDCYTFTTPGGSATLSSLGMTDTKAWLTDQAGNTLSTGYDSGPGNNFLIQQQLTAGTYFLTVVGEDADYDTGAYTLVASFPERQPTQIQADSTTTTSPFIPGQFSIYEFEIHEPSLLACRTTGITPTSAALYRDTEPVTAAAASGSQEGFSFTSTELMPGSYFLRVFSHSGEGYTLVTRSLNRNSRQLVASALSTPTGTQMSMSFQKAGGWIYRLQKSADCRTWTTLRSYSAFTSGPQALIDTSAAPAKSMFYRLEISPL